MTDTNLKPCPFCGGKATLVYNDDRTCQVICDDCGSCSDCYDERWNPDNEVIDAWNSRPAEDKKDKEIKRLRETLETIQKISNYMSASNVTVYDLIGINNICCDALEGKEQ